MKMPAILNRFMGNARAGAEGQPTPYVGADHRSQELSSWNPAMLSADRTYLQDRNTVVARTRDLIRNSGWASSGVTRHLDNAIGTGFRLAAKPDYAALGLTPEWAATFAADVEGRWRLYAEDQSFYIDACRQDDFNGLLRLAYRQRIADGESLALALWIEGKPGDRYATTIQIVDTDRLSNPMGQSDNEYLRAGIEVDALGAPLAYHFTKAHPNDVLSFSSKNYQWERVEAELAFGAGGNAVTRKRVIHAFEKDRAGQTRGVSLFAPIIERMKMLDRYDRYELQAALINSVLAAYIESPMDHDFLSEMLESDGVSKYQDERKGFHDARGLKLNGARVPMLFPGEKINMLSPTRPSSAFAEFERACLRNIAAGLGLSYEQLSQDWSQVNYSSARAALMEVWKSLASNRQDFATKFATQIYILWMQEAIYRGDIKLPPGAPAFEAAKAAYCKCKWIGQGRGYVDPEKEANAANMRINSGLSTLEDECAEQGKDWQEVLHQRKREVDMMTSLDLKLPDWAANPSPQHIARQQGKGEE